MMTLRKNNGQGVIEALISLPALALAVSAIFVLLYRATVFHYADYHLHEALLCTDHSNLSECESALSHQLGKILWFGSQHEVTLQKKYHGTKGKIAIELTPALVLSQEIDLPLRIRRL